MAHYFWLTCDGISDVVFALDLVVQLRTGYLEQGLMVSRRLVHSRTNAGLRELLSYSIIICQYLSVLEGMLKHFQVFFSLVSNLIFSKSIKINHLLDSKF